MLATLVHDSWTGTAFSSVAYLVQHMSGIWSAMALTQNTWHCFGAENTKIIMQCETRHCRMQSTKTLPPHPPFPPQLPYFTLFGATTPKNKNLIQGTSCHTSIQGYSALKVCQSIFMEEVIIYRIRVIFGQVSQQTFPVSSLRSSIISNRLVVVMAYDLPPTRTLLHQVQQK